MILGAIRVVPRIKFAIPGSYECPGNSGNSSQEQAFVSGLAYISIG